MNCLRCGHDVNLFGDSAEIEHWSPLRICPKCLFEWRVLENENGNMLVWAKNQGAEQVPVGCLAVFSWDEC